MISLCIISRKEDEGKLKEAISSCAQYVDEVHVLDTSKTGKIDALELSNPYVTVALKHFDWNDDFSAARNFSFAGAKGDVIFWLDSDDLVTNPQNLPKLAKQITDGKADWIYCKYNYHTDEWGNVDAFHQKPRLFRKGTVKWEKTVHENAVPTTGVVQVKDIETGVGEVIIEHQMDMEHENQSLERNLGIMLVEYERDGKKTDPRTLQYIGMTLEGLERYKEALPFFSEHIMVSGSQSDKFWSLHRLQRCLHKTGELRGALSVCLDSLKLYPEWKTSYFDLANIYYDLGDWEKVIEWTLVGMEKQTPDVLDVINELDYTLLPMGRLAEAYLHMMRIDLMYDLAVEMMRINPKMPMVKEMYNMAKEAVGLEDYVKAFLRVAVNFSKYDRVKTSQLFDLIPEDLDNDARIQEARFKFVPPKTWEDKSVVIYCGSTLDDWAYPSIFSGIGGGEEAVINISEQLAKQGYKVTVYNQCGKMRGVYNKVGDGFVEYKPHFHFNQKDNFNVLIGWRCPGLFLLGINAKKKYLWLHDILFPESINEKVVDNLDKILFVSKWHSSNLNWIPEDKKYITNNGIDPKHFENLPAKRPNSLIWSSSYDRGLLPFIKNILPLIKKEIPEVTLDVAYGWNNILKIKQDNPDLRKLYDELSPILDNTPGITHHGRISHQKLASLMGECMVYPYASEFGETCNITSMKCQAAGCYVVTCSGAGGTHERVRFGKVIDCEDIYTNKKKQKEFAEAVISQLKNPEVFKIDVSDFSWETTAKQWAKDLL